MSGWVYCHGPCIACGRIFSYNPNHVPSTRALTGKREPVCGPCIVRLNAKRAQLGLEPWTISPMAYEPEPEEELNWGGGDSYDPPEPS